MEKTFIGVRGVDEEMFRKFRALAIQKRLKLGEALTEAMEKVIEEEKQENKPHIKNFLEMKPIKVGSKKVRWSEEVDEFLYGLKK